MAHTKKQIPRDKLIKDLVKASEKVDGYLSNAKYREVGQFSTKTLGNRFGSWSQAKEVAGLETRTANGYQPDHFKSREDKHRMLRQIREGVGCLVCGCNPKWPAVEFHHLPQYEKEYAISRMVSENKSWQDIKAELKKCAPVCSNCHREMHAGVTNPPWEEAEANDEA